VERSPLLHRIFESLRSSHILSRSWNTQALLVAISSHEVLFTEGRSLQQVFGFVTFSLNIPTLTPFSLTTLQLRGRVACKLASAILHLSEGRYNEGMSCFTHLLHLLHGGGHFGPCLILLETFFPGWQQSLIENFLVDGTDQATGTALLAFGLFSWAQTLALQINCSKHFSLIRQAPSVNKEQGESESLTSDLVDQILRGTLFFSLLLFDFF